MDNLLKKLPVFGLFFERSYAFWRAHVALANMTHIALGAGVALLVISDQPAAVGWTLFAVAFLMHIVAFVGGHTRP